MRQRLVWLGGPDETFQESGPDPLEISVARADRSAG